MGKRKLLTFSRFRGAGTSLAVVLGIALTMAIFAFQTVQLWVTSVTAEKAVQWSFATVAAIAVFLLFALMHAYYWLLRAQAPPAAGDPYREFVDGIMSFGRELHAQRRDPAMLRLRENESHTLHVLGFHEERVALGTWALESAQFVNDQIAVLAILTDDLGWANYLLGREVATVNIEKAIRYGEQLPADFGEPRKSMLLAKAYRHHAVIRTAQSSALQDAEFDRAKELLAGIADAAPREARVELAQVAHAEALAIATMLSVNVAGTLRRADTDGTALLHRALELAREAKDGFNAAHDQGRFAKSLVLEVRILEALRDDDEAQHLIPLRDRAVAASVWARPAGAAFMTGR